MSEPTETIHVEIFGSAYSLRGGADPASVRALASELDAKMRELAGPAQGADSLKVAVLTALRLAEEARRLRREISARDERLASRVGALAERLGRALATPPPEPGEAALDGGRPLG